MIGPQPNSSVRAQRFSVFDASFVFAFAGCRSFSSARRTPVGPSAKEAKLPSVCMCNQQASYKLQGGMDREEGPKEQTKAQGGFTRTAQNADILATYGLAFMGIP